MESLHLGVPVAGPLGAQANGQALQMAGADGQTGQGQQVGAALLEGPGGGSVQDLLEGGRGVTLGAQPQSLIQGGKTPPGRPGSGSGRVAA